MRHIPSGSCRKSSRPSRPAGTVVNVAAGLVFRRGRLLIAQRPPGRHLGGLWEFPGGKLERGESLGRCLVRELREELGIEVEIGPVVARVTHAYPGKTVRLCFFVCRWKRHEPRPLGCPAFAWVTASELEGYVFPAADARLLERLRGSWARWQAGLGVSRKVLYSGGS